MYRWINACVLVILVAGSAGAASAAEVKLEVVRDGKTTVTQDGQTVWQMRTMLFTPDWKGQKEVKPEADYPKKTEGKTEFRCALVPQGQDGVVNVTLTVSVQKNTAEFHYVFDVPKALTLNALSVSTRMPVDLVSGKMLKLGGMDVELPAVHTQGVKSLFRGNFERATYPIPDLEIQLTTEPETFCRVQDQREWGGSDYELRIELLTDLQNQGIAAGAKYEKKITVRIPGLTESIIGKVGP